MWTDDLDDVESSDFYRSLLNFDSIDSIGAHTDTDTFVYVKTPTSVHVQKAYKLTYGMFFWLKTLWVESRCWIKMNQESVSAEWRSFLAGSISVKMNPVFFFQQNQEVGFSNFRFVKIESSNFAVKTNQSISIFLTIVYEWMSFGIFPIFFLLKSSH